jgi:hypothetical protein
MFLKETKKDKPHAKKDKSCCFLSYYPSVDF